MSTFNNTELNTQYRKIELLIAKAKQFEPDDELRSHMAKYICVLCSGFLENAIYHLFSDIAIKETNSQIVQSFTKANLLKIQNPNSFKIREVVKCFNIEWHDKLRDYMQENERAAAINYIIKDRHNIAHGKDSNITINIIESHLEKVIDVFKYMEENLR